MVARKQREALAAVLPVYRNFAARGQIEISTTPFYHPILPLLCASDIGAKSHPGLPLPTRFRYPQDAREQLCRSRSYVHDKLGVTPVGLWPSEASVSDEALTIAADCGFTSAAIDDRVLGGGGASAARRQGAGRGGRGAGGRAGLGAEGREHRAWRPKGAVCGSGRADASAREAAARRRR